MNGIEIKVSILMDTKIILMILVIEKFTLIANNLHQKK
jgi:hypothetical protein